MSSLAEPTKNFPQDGVTYRAFGSDSSLWNWSNEDYVLCAWNILRDLEASGYSNQFGSLKETLTDKAWARSWRYLLRYFNGEIYAEDIPHAPYTNNTARRNAAQESLRNMIYICRNNLRGAYKGTSLSALYLALLASDTEVTRAAPITEDTNVSDEQDEDTTFSYRIYRENVTFGNISKYEDMFRSVVDWRYLRRRAFKESWYSDNVKLAMEQAWLQGDSTAARVLWDMLTDAGCNSPLLEQALVWDPIYFGSAGLRHVFWARFEGEVLIKRVYEDLYDIDENGFRVRAQPKKQEQEVE